MTVGALVAFNMFAQRVSGPVVRLAQTWQDFQQVRLSIERLGDILDHPVEREIGANADLPAMQGAVRFDAVRFRYAPDTAPVLNDVTFSLPAGMSLGIVGSSGSGKSTLTKLLQRLYMAESGRVSIDGIDIAQADPAWLRRQIGVVLQENILFNRTIRDNIALANPAMPLDRVIRAARLAGAHDFITEQPQGYDTPIVERGVNLSGGQRQRIAIARALVTDPRVLILDEATSALDAESEEIIRCNLKAIATGRTVIVIAHRLSAVRECDNIIALERGTIVEGGTHADLLAAGGRYAETSPSTSRQPGGRSMNALTTNWTQIRAALAEDRAREAARLRIDDAAFLPAVLEVIERPVSPTARLTGRVLTTGVAALIAWLVFGKTEVVAVATGQIVPVGQTQLVQPAEAGVVRRILVHDGDHVVKGQPLVLLDPTVSGAEAAQAAKAYETAAFDAARARAVVDALDGKLLHVVAPSGSDPAALSVQEELARARLADARASITASAANGAVARADIASARSSVAKIDKSLPLLDQQLTANEQLAAMGYVSKLRVLDIRRQRIAEAGEREAALVAIRRATATEDAASSSTGKTLADMRATLLDEMVKAQADMRLRREELIKAQTHSGFQALRAPVTGTVGQLAIHTEGGVVEAGKPIMTVVPADGKLIAEVKLLNRDAGFVRPGQAAMVKLDAFPFGRYGAVHGHVLSISPDAIPDDKLGPIYMVRVALDRTSISRKGEAMPLIPGMTTTADIVTGRRSYLSYLTSPVAEAAGSALKER